MSQSTANQVSLSDTSPKVLPKPGQLIGHSQAPPPVARETERGAEEGSSGAGELSDSMSVGEVAVTRVRRKKARVRFLPEQRRVIVVALAWQQ